MQDSVEEYIDINHYVETHSQDTEYADHLMIQAAANALNTNIDIIGTDGVQGII